MTLSETDLLSERRSKREKRTNKGSDLSTSSSTKIRRSTRNNGAPPPTTTSSTKNTGKLKHDKKHAVRPRYLDDTWDRDSDLGPSLDDPIDTYMAQLKHMERAEKKLGKLESSVQEIKVRRSLPPHCVPEWKKTDPALLNSPYLLPLSPDAKQRSRTRDLPKSFWKWVEIGVKLYEEIRHELREYAAEGVKAMFDDKDLEDEYKRRLKGMIAAEIKELEETDFPDIETLFYVIRSNMKEKSRSQRKVNRRQVDRRQVDRRSKSSAKMLSPDTRCTSKHTQQRSQSIKSSRRDLSVDSHTLKSSSSTDSLLSHSSTCSTWSSSNDSTPRSQMSSADFIAPVNSPVSPISSRSVKASSDDASGDASTLDADDNNSVKSLNTYDTDKACIKSKKAGSLPAKCSLSSAKYDHEPAAPPNTGIPRVTTQLSLTPMRESKASTASSVVKIEKGLKQKKKQRNLSKGTNSNPEIITNELVKRKGHKTINTSSANGIGNLTLKDGCDKLKKVSKRKSEPGRLADRSALLPTALNGGKSQKRSDVKVESAVIDDAIKQTRGSHRASQKETQQKRNPILSKRDNNKTKGYEGGAEKMPLANNSNRKTNDRVDKKNVVKIKQNQDEKGRQFGLSTRGAMKKEPEIKRHTRSVAHLTTSDDVCNELEDIRVANVTVKGSTTTSSIDVCKSPNKENEQVVIEIITGDIVTPASKTAERSTFNLPMPMLTTAKPPPSPKRARKVESSTTKSPILS